MIKEFKLDVGDIGWFISDREVRSGKIESVTFNKKVNRTPETLIEYFVTGKLTPLPERYIFSSKEALIQSLQEN